MRTEEEIWKEAQHLREIQPEFGTRKTDSCIQISGFLRGAAFALGVATNDFCTELDRRIELQKTPLHKRMGV